MAVGNRGNVEQTFLERYLDEKPEPVPYLQGNLMNIDFTPTPEQQVKLKELWDWKEKSSEAVKGLVIGQNDYLA